MNKDDNPYNAGHFLRYASHLIPEPNPSGAPGPYPKTTEQGHGNKSAAWPLQQKTDKQANPEFYDTSVMGSHPPVEESDSA